MRLHRLLPSLQRHPSFQRVLEAVQAPTGLAAHTPPTGATATLVRSQPAVVSAITPARAYVVAALYAALGRPMLLLAARPGEARRYADELRPWLPDADAVCLFPEMDALPYDYLPNDPQKLADRLAALGRLAGVVDGGAAGAPLVVASARAAMDLLADPQEFRARQLPLSTGQAISPARLAQDLVALGYEPAPVVDQSGQFGRRGGIVDVFPPGGDPLRVEFWGDEIDTIRVFDPSTQRSTRHLPRAAVGPAHEVLPRQPRAALRALDLASVRPQFAGAFERDWRLLAEGQAFPALEFYRGLLGTATLVDYLPTGGLVVVEEPPALAAVALEFERQVEQLHADLLAQGEVPKGLPTPYRSLPGTLARLGERVQTVALAYDPDRDSLPFQHAPKFGGRVETFLQHVREQDGGRRHLVVSQQAERLADLLQQADGLHVPVAEEAPTEPGAVTLLHGTLREGWVSPELGLALLTDSELFGWTKQRRSAASGSRRRAERSAAAREQFLADLRDGDLVVHEEHGIGRFRGLIRTAVGFTPEQQVRPGAAHAPPGTAEFLLLEYAEGDRLYVPISQADRVARYVGAGDAEPRLTRLGSGEWSRAKAKVRRSVRDIARELMDLYAARQEAEGHAYPTDTTWQQELEASFAFEETPDQVQAVRAVKEDMQRPRPMDRLLVGDVGFGKTEVALRAAFKAVQDGRQVAVLVPTTVLAQQHHNTFRDRLAAFPVRVEVLSRFRSEKEQRAVLRGLADGSVDICIGTHRLVQRDVRFKDLGLVIIDEEQRFGVAHKERLKQLRHEVDVLTLTATPIPRTLHMGLVGVRDMSLLETAPEARLPVRTYVAEYDEGLVREAVLREIDRGGQVYFVHNRVQGIESIAARLKQLVPDARIGVGHGQLPEDELEETMLAFAEGEYDVLVCTTIIESGLDIPNANTLIVNNAHRFGLAQLYQLRGRVGRSTARAYAYFLYTRDLLLSEVASERLKTIFEATELGAGMRIAMKDLEIRGAGNLLGAEQSGNIASVGYELYTKLLAEQVELLKASRAVQDGSRDGWSGGVVRAAPAAGVSLDLPLSAFIPPEYVPDDAVRLRLYQRVAGLAADTELGSLVAELEDRFGTLPEPVQQLVYLASLRLRAMEKGVEQVTATNGELVVRLGGTPPASVDWLSRAVGVPVARGSNQLRLPRDGGRAWMGHLYALLEALPARS